MPHVEVVSKAPEAVKVLVIGGCYAGLAAALNLLDLCNGKPTRFSGKPLEEPQPLIPLQITIVDERDGYYHVISTPLALASSEYAPKAWVKFSDIPALQTPAITVIQGSAKEIDCEKKVARIVNKAIDREYEESYDYLIVASGLRRTWPVVPQSLKREDYLSEALGHVDAVTKARECVAVIGGGAVGIEMAAEIKVTTPSQTVKLIHSHSKLLTSEPLPDDFKDRALQALQDAGVEVILDERVMDTQTVEPGLQRLTLKDGSTLLAGHVIWAISHSVPTSTYLPFSTLDKDGYVNISPTMNFLPSPTLSNAQHHFAIGDIASWSGIRRCGGAMAMGNIAARNIHQQLLQNQTGKIPKYIELPEFVPMIALAVGKEAVLYGPEDGTTCGEDLMEMMFGTDLGWSICWRYLQLGVAAEQIEGEKGIEKGSVL